LEEWDLVSHLLRHKAPINTGIVAMQESKDGQGTTLHSEGKMAVKI